MLGWIGWSLCFSGNVLIGNRNRMGFIVTFVSECLLIVHAHNIADYSLAAACLAWMGLHVRNYLKWRHLDAPHRP